jgi:hypothetical protein
LERIAEYLTRLLLGDGGLANLRTELTKVMTRSVGCEFDEALWNQREVIRRNFVVTYSAHSDANIRGCPRANRCHNFVDELASQVAAITGSGVA